MKSYPRKAVASAWFVLTLGGVALAQQEPKPAPGSKPEPAGEVPWTDNRLTNPSFEDGETGWNVRMGAHKPDAERRVNSEIGLDDETAHSGDRSLRLSANSDTTWWWAVESAAIPAKPARRYKFGGWIKTEDVTVEEGQFANCNFYIQFRNDKDEVIYVDESPVRGTPELTGTNGWTHMERRVKAPEGATRVVVGCVLTSTGKAWFDNLFLHEAADIDWVALEAGRFVYFFEDGTEPPPETSVEVNNRHLEALEAALGIPYPKKVRFYKYASSQRKAEITGSDMAGHHEGDEIHATGWTDRHSLVHVLMAEVGSSNLFFAEGIAEYWDKLLLGKDPHRQLRFLARGGMLPLERMLDPMFFGRLAPRTGHPLAGSFVGYLVERFGMDRFKELYKQLDYGLSIEQTKEKIKDVYEESFADLEKAWKAYLTADDATPTDDAP